MYGFKVTNKPSVFYSVEVIDRTDTKKTVVNSRWIPLIFRTDNAARDIGKRWCHDLNNQEQGCQMYTLSNLGIPIITASLDTISRVIKHWGAQKIYIGELSISNKFEGIMDDDKRAKVIEIIKKGATEAAPLNSIAC
ncbi:hypothetical protein VCHA53O466_40207 [Vibrio chagasii]|nr:hypothetical protein VCHA53O466_40207 [Vibrio chagasii]